MSSLGAALGAAFVSTARAEASRLNGAKSRGPRRTPEGKARSSQNALEHGLRAEKFTVVGDEDVAAYDAHAQALVAELAPEGALQSFLAERIARAAWRLERTERIEAELFDLHAGADGDLGLAMIRDGNGTRAFDTLLRYRRAAEAELWRALRTLKALQAEQARASAPTPAVPPEPHAEPSAQEKPIEPDARRNPAEPAPTPAPDEPAPARAASLRDPATLEPSARHAPAAGAAHCTQPIEPEAGGNPGGMTIPPE